MKEFLDFLRKGKFRVPTCNNCNAKIWPPSNICKECFSREIRMSKLDPEGQLIEFSESFIDKNKNLGLVEISGIRVIGIINDGNVNQGSIVKLSKCGLDINNSPYYEFSPT
jgi:uncharacterized OB-fold protein